MTLMLGVAAIVAAAVFVALVKSVSVGANYQTSPKAIDPPAPATEPNDASSPPATSPDEPATQPQNKNAVIEKVTIGGEQFRLELAADPPTRAKGLMGRTSIATYGGMLFVHTRPELQGYWMAHCQTDMDIMFLDTRGRIVAAYTMKMEPPKRDDETEWQYEARMKRYESRQPAQFAIELKAGTIERLKLKAGMVINLDLERLKKLAR